MARIKKGDYVRAMMLRGACTGCVIGKSSVDGVMRYDIRTSDDYVLSGLYASQLTKITEEQGDE